MCSLASLLTVLAVAASAAAAGPSNATCAPSQLDMLSCSAAAHAPDADTCCVNMPGGLLLQTQYYAWNPSLGPRDSWTLHGLWPDYCNGSYPSSGCDDSRNYTDLVTLMLDHGEQRTLRKMFEYWQNDPAVTGAEGGSEDLWAHEWGKHGTCISTLDPSCYGSSYSRGAEFADFAVETVELFESLPTFDFLARCGIVPTNSTTYPITGIESCLTKATGGFLPHIGCTGDSQEYLSEVWYYYHTRGKARGGTYEAMNTTYGTNCADRVSYPPKL